MVSGFDVPVNQSIVRICYNGYNQQVEPQLALFHGYNGFSPCHKLGFEMVPVKKEPRGHNALSRSHNCRCAMACRTGEGVGLGAE